MRPAAFFALAMLALGCDDDDKDKDRDRNKGAAAPLVVSTSRIEGKLELTTFAGPAGEVVALNEANVRLAAPVAPGGEFFLDLAKGHVYRLLVIAAPAEIPIVFPRVGGRLDRNFRVSNGNAIVSLGVVRGFGKNPDTGFAVHAPGAADPAACVDGLVKDSTNACVVELPTVSCVLGAVRTVDDRERDRDDDEHDRDDDEHDRDDDEHDRDDDEHDRDDDDDDDDRRAPAVTGIEEDADPALPFAVPDRNAPNDVAGCND